MSSVEIFKLSELRAKTDRELLAVIGTELNRGLVIASVAATRESPLYQHASKSLDRITKLLPTIFVADLNERKALEANIKEMQRALDLVPMQPGRAYSCCTSAA